MSFNGKQILLIDPEPRHEVELFLRGLGLEVRPVTGMEAALEAVTREEFDMALVDVARAASLEATQADVFSECMTAQGYARVR